MKLFLTTVLAVAALSSGSIVKPSGRNFELLILHNNDMHARFEQTSQLSGACTTADREAGKCYGGFPRVAHVVKEARRAAETGEGPPVLYLNAGDTYTGTAWFTIYKWKIAAEFVNALQPDAVCLGNHDFDNGISELVPFIKSLKCPVVAANLNLSRVPELQYKENLVKSVVLNVDNTKVGIIGYLTPETKVLAIKNDVEYIKEITAIEQEIAKLKREGVNILIALGHSGYLKDLEIAKKVKDIDLVIGGHSHTMLWNGTTPDIEVAQGIYPTLVRQESGRIVPTVQAYAYTKYLGKLRMHFNTDGEIVQTDGNPILLDNTIPQDPDVLQIVNDYHDKVQKFTERIVGSTLVNLEHWCRLRECNLGNLITDSIVFKYASQYKGKGWSDVPIAVINGGSIRSSIKSINLPINITQGDLIGMMPFTGYLKKISLNGTTVIKMLEHSVAMYNPLDSVGQFLQVSGIKVDYNVEKPPGERVENVYMRCGECSEPEYFILNGTKTYKILTSDFVADGGDGFSVLAELPTTPVDFTVHDAILEYLMIYSPINPSVEGRIVINNGQRIELPK